VIESNYQNQWVVNLSDCKLSEEELSVLSLDPKFQIAPKNIPYEKILANIESKLSDSNIPKVEIETIRNKISTILSFSKKPFENLTKNQIRTIKSLKRNKKIFVTFSDKGNRTVVLNTTDYNNKVETILNDETIYKPLKKNIIESIARKTIEKVKALKKSNSINEFTFKYLYLTYYRTPQIYALIKIHKKDNPCRIICPYFEHPCAKLTKHLSHILSQIMRCDENSIRDSNGFAKFIQNFEISEDEIMASLDIINLFTNIPIEFTLKIIRKKNKKSYKLK
jgi:hypothetical protein